jgi:DNA repair protein RadC
MPYDVRLNQFHQHEETRVNIVAPIYQCRLVRDGSVKLFSEEKIGSPATACKILQEYLSGLDREHLAVLFLDMKNRIIGINTVSVGTVNSTLVVPANVFKPAILANAASIMLAHNHPSGETIPSREDLKVTETILELGKMLGIELLDHIIVVEGRYLSLREAGLGGF